MAWGEVINEEWDISSEEERRQGERGQRDLQVNETQPVDWITSTWRVPKFTPGLAQRHRQ